MSEHQNIVLLTIDSLRADCCGFLGGDESATPSLDGMADDGLVFENAVAPGPRTPSSMPTIFTGEFYPPLNEWSYDDWRQRRQRIRDHLSRHPTIPERLQSRGYSTAGFTANPWTRRDTRFEKGFDEFYELTTKNGEMTFDDADIPLGLKIADRVLDWTGQGERVNWENKRDWFLQWPGFSHHIIETIRRLEQPYFLWVFLLGPHEPYLSPRAYRTENTTLEMYYSAFRYWYQRRKWFRSNPNEHFPAGEILPSHVEKRLWQGYRDAVRSVDGFVEILRESLDDDTILIVHSDHGEAFREHGTYGHQPLLYEENIHVPLIVSNVYDSGFVSDPISLRKLPHMISSIVNPSSGVKARDLTSDFVISRTESGDTVAVRSQRWKYISGNPDPELYDLLNDPRESVNLAPDAPEVVHNFQCIRDTHQQDVVEKDLVSRAGKHVINIATERL